MESGDNQPTVTPVDVRGARGVVVGDGATQHNYFYRERLAQPMWPIVVGRPPQVATSFQDRPYVQRHLENVLRRSGTAVVTQVVSGDGGVGKTQLAARIFEEASTGGETQLSVWVTATSRQAILATYTQALARIDPSVYSERPELAADAFLQWLREAQIAWIVVLDDLFEPDHLEDYWPACLSGRTLVTTCRRDSWLSESGRTIVDVGVFRSEESINYLKSRLASLHAHPQAATGAEELATALGHLPLALAQASAVILDGGIRCVDYLDEFNARTSRLSDLFPAEAKTGSQRTVATTWALAIDTVNQLEPVSVSGLLAAVIAFLDPNGIPEEVLVSSPVSSYIAKRLNLSTRPSRAQLRKAIRNLHRLSLVTHSPGEASRSVRMHALAQRATREAIPQAETIDVALTAAKALEVIWEAAGLGADLVQILTDNALVLLELSEAALWAGGGEDLLWRVGHSLTEVGLVTEAAAYWQSLVQRSGEHLGPYHPKTFTARADLALCLGRSGNAIAASQALRLLLDDQARVLGAMNKRTLATRSAYAYWLGRTGDAVGAVGALGELLADQERTLGSDDPATLTTRATLAYWRGRSGDPVGAVAALEQLLPDRLRVLGPDHPDTLSTRHSLAYWRGPAGDITGAVRDLAAVLPDRARILGADHPDTLTTRHELARWIGRSGKPGEAAEAFGKLLADRLRILGPDHPDTLATRGNLGLWRAAAGDVNFAVTVFDKLVTDRLRVQGPDHPETVTSQHHLAVLRGRAGDPQTALLGLQRVYADRIRVLGEAHPDTFLTRYEMALMRDRAGERARALDDLEDLLQDQLHHLGANHPDIDKTRRAIEDLAH